MASQAEQPFVPTEIHLQTDTTSRMPAVMECMQKREIRHRDSGTNRRLCRKGRLNGSAMTQMYMVATT